MKPQTLLFHGDCWELLPGLAPTFIVTDCPIRQAEKLGRWCQNNGTLCYYVNAWLEFDPEREHPAGKLVEPFRRLIEAFPDERLIVDPFMGSGSIGVAAIMAGRDYIGIERDRKWFDLARRRIDQALVDAGYRQDVRRVPGGADEEGAVEPAAEPAT